jgi:dTMP kinase
MYKKPVIVFEGTEGSGKTLHINFVSKYLKKKKIKHIIIREPGGNNNSEKIRKLILDNKSNFNRNTDLLLYFAARSENVETLKKNYKKKIILIDRFIDSTIAYQHFGFGIKKSIIDTIQNFLMKSLKPDFTFLNIVSLKNIKLRLKNRKKLNRYDKFDIRFYEKVQRGFLKILKKKKKRYMIINSDLDVDFNKKMVINKINQLIK